MTTKFDNFVAELKELCIKHQIGIDTGYEGCLLYNLNGEREYYEFWDINLEEGE